VLVANRAWDEILREPEPPASCYIQPPFTKQDGCRILRATWHWARGMAYGAMSQRNAALHEYAELVAERKRIQPPDPTAWGNNTAFAVLDIAEETVLARVMWEEKKRDTAIEHLKLAVTHEDALAYDEPPQWFHPARQSLGGAYLAVKNYPRARTTFEDDLKRHPKNGRSLYGLARALEGLGDPAWHEVQKKYEDAWKAADYKMTEGELW
jgi:tetratricopeptide (TPR) repeat protein